MRIAVTGGAGIVGSAVIELALARGERQQLAGALESVDISALVADAWRSFAARADARSLPVDVRLAPATAAADPVLLRSVLANLFDNAVDYTPAGGSIALGVAAFPDGRTTISLTNSTENLTAEDVAHLFDPFWRKEAARSGGLHVGLGLSLARAFSGAMGWTLSATLDAERRLVLRLVSGAALPPKSH